MAPRREEKCIPEWRAHSRDRDSYNHQHLSCKKTLHLVRMCFWSLSANIDPLFASSENISGCRSLGHAHFSTPATLSSLNYVERTLLWSPLCSVGRGLCAFLLTQVGAVGGGVSSYPPCFLNLRYLLSWHDTWQLVSFQSPKPLTREHFRAYFFPSFVSRKK